MTKARAIDFTTVNWRQKEAPDCIPALGKYKPTGSNDTVVIDAGSWQFRAGYASKDLPAVVFDPVLHRFQSKAGEPAQFHAGRMVPTGMVRASSKPLYEDGNVINQPSTLEHILDTIFSKLHIHANDESILHPIFMTEVVGNPPSCRKEISELIFEAYNAPRLCYGVDGPLAWFANKKSANALVISIGNYTTVVAAIIDGRIEHIRRIEFGGHVASETMLQLMQCKYPAFPTKMTLVQSQEVVHRACRFALDYDETLTRLIQSDASLAEHDVKVQFPYSFETLAEKQQKEEAREQLTARRREQAQKLRERAEKQRAEKLEAKRQQLDSMSRLEKQVSKTATIRADGEFNDEEEEESMDQLRLFGYADIEELQAAIVAEQKELDRMMGIEEPKEAPDYSLVDIPDSNLSPEQIKEKRKQRLLKNSAEARERMRKEKEEEAQRAGEQKKALDQRRLNDFSGWKNDLYTERQELTKMIKVRQKKKEALSDRKSQAAGARLRNVVALVEEDEEEALNAKSTKSNATKRKKTMKQPAIPENDSFGDNDADWLIYRQINRDDEAEGERDEEIQKRLSEIEEQLEQFDPDAFFDLVASEMSKAVTIVDRLKNGVTDEGDDPSARANQLHVNVERYRAVEGLFQPGAILGLDQAGLVETIEDLLKVVDPSQRDSLSANIFLTGGACQAEGLVARLEQDLRAVLQVGAPLSITLGTDPILDTWRGAALLCREDSSNLPWITREWYQEHGGERLPSNSWFTNPH